MDNFTSKEIDTLIEALEKWEVPDFAGELLGALFNSTIKDPIQKEKMEREDAIKREKKETENRQRREVSTLLKAKLIMLKQSAAIERATEQA